MLVVTVTGVAPLSFAQCDAIGKVSYVAMQPTFRTVRLHVSPTTTCRGLRLLELVGQQRSGISTMQLLHTFTSPVP